MIERFVEILFVANFDKIIEIEFNSNLNVMNTNKSKSSKEKKIKINSSKFFHLLFIFKSKSKHYDVDILNHETFANINRSNVNAMKLKDLNLFNHQKTSESIKLLKSSQKFSSFFILNINERKPFTLKQINVSKNNLHQFLKFYIIYDLILINQIFCLKEWKKKNQKISLCD